MHDPPDKHVPFLLQSSVPTFSLGIGCATLCSKENLEEKLKELTIIN